MKKSIKISAGMFIELFAAVVGLVSIIQYGNSYATSSKAYAFLIAAAVVGVIATALAQFLPKLFNWCAPVAAALAAAGIGYSVTVMVDAIGYVVSGLYSFDTIKSWITFLVAAGISLLLYIVACFTGLAKEK